MKKLLPYLCMYLLFCFFSIVSINARASDENETPIVAGGTPVIGENGSTAGSGVHGSGHGVDKPNTTDPDRY